METLARCVDVDRLYIWKNRSVKGKLFYFQEHEWVGARAADTLKAKQGYSYMESIPEWENKFSKGEVVGGPITTLSETEQEILSPFGIKSILVIPIFLQERFWGFLSFDDCRRERDFPEDMINILRFGGMLIANAIERHSKDLIISSRLRQQDLMSDISQSFISNEPMETLINESLRRVGEFLKVTRILVVTADEKTDKSRPIYQWFLSDVWKPKEVQVGFNELINSTFPKYMPVKGYVPTVHCNDVFTDAGGKYAVLSRADNKSFIWAPVYVNGSYWGMITVEECEHTREWSSSDIQLVGTISSSIAGAIARDLMEKQREAALEQAVQASLAKGNFLSNMSHEMRTPMNAIIGMTAIGKGAGDIDKKNYAFGKIEDASTHLLGVINDILDMSKIEANKLELSLVSFNFEKMLQKVVNVINFRVEERKQSFYVSIDKQIPRTLIGDDQRLAQVITNLLSNAVKFTPEGGTIRLNAGYVKEEPLKNPPPSRQKDQTAVQSDGNCIIRIEVTDTGIGISGEQQARLFNSFEQAENTTTRKYGGTGLGLAISKRIVEMMGGTIWIDSRLGGGSTFAFTARLGYSGKEQKLLLKQGVNWNNIRLMAVDDEPEILNYFKEIAQNFGVECDTAKSGEEALKLIEQNGDYDIYFIDWKMPGMNGLELSGKIDAKGTQSVVTMISAAALSDFEAAAKDAGVDKFLSKPLFSSDIADLINNCLGVPEILGAAEAKKSGGDDFSGYTILLAEDVEINREIVLALLEPTGISIDCAENGAEALQMFISDPGKYGMIFMDVQMPEMDGYEATRRIRAWEAEHPPAGDRKQIPIVAMTANVFKEDVEKSLNAGMNDHVGKPLDFDEVLVKLRSYLTKADGAGGSDDAEAWKYGWTPELLTGNREIDSQHKQIFRLTGTLAAACISGHGTEMLGETLDFLASYTERHFADEEALMRDHGYPAYGEHKQLHDDFKITVSNLTEEFKTGGSSRDLLDKVNSVMVHWLVEHIKQEDYKIARWISSGAPPLPNGP
jgi:hemerythrin-like metal-binding protein